MRAGMVLSSSGSSVSFTAVRVTAPAGAGKKGIMSAAHSTTVSSFFRMFFIGGRPLSANHTNTL